MNAKKVLDVQQIQKNFGKVHALRNVTFQVNRGEVFGFIGPNGAGKTTTIRVILGIIKASAGKATMFNQDVWQNRVAIHRRLAYVPGDVYLWPNLTGGEIIDLFLKMNGEKHSKWTDELIERFDLDPKKKARTYSKGNRQKVALIAAFSQGAECYIFDEPTSGLDPLMEEVFQEEVLKLKNEGKAILLSSHILSEVERMCDRIAIIREGTIIEQGTLDEMRHLTRTQITVTTSDDAEIVKNISGVHGFTIDQRTPGKISFSVDTEAVGEVMRVLTEKNILAIQSTPPTLEDLFLRYYKQGSDQRKVTTDYEK
ncbi:ABC transporter ATP-binding protein [Pediococcus acidilactici]